MSTLKYQRHSSSSSSLLNLPDVIISVILSFAIETMIEWSSYQFISKWFYKICRYPTSYKYIRWRIYNKKKLESLFHFHRLRTLIIDGINIQYDELELICNNMKHLESIQFNHSRIPDFIPIYKLALTSITFAFCTHLKSLDCISDTVEKLNIINCESLPSNPFNGNTIWNLKQLSIQLQYINQSAIEAISTISSLEYLFLNVNGKYDFHLFNENQIHENNTNNNDNNKLRLTSLSKLQLTSLILAGSNVNILDIQNVITLKHLALLYLDFNDIYILDIIDKMLKLETLKISVPIDTNYISQKYPTLKIDVVWCYNL